MSKARLKRVGAAIAPEWAAQYAARRAYDKAQPDPDHIGSAAKLTERLTSYDIISFDLFDTIVWRQIALEDVHAKTAGFADQFLTGDHGPLPTGLLLHARGRYQEEIKARGKDLKEGYRNEVDLTDVFNGALAPYIADPERRGRAVQAAMTYEIETESRILTVDPSMRKMLEDLNAGGKTLLLTSDMYFPEKHLKHLLKQLDLLHFFDHVFVSASVGVTKHSGMLFDHIDAFLGLDAARRIHIGDNATNDVAQPRSRGWDALHYFNRTNEERKHRLEASSRLGVPQNTRAARRLISDVTGTQADKTAVNLMAAGLSDFARYVISTTIREQFDRVLFLTRDGTLFRDLATQFLEATGAQAHLDMPQMEELAFSRRAGILLNYPGKDAPHWHDYLAGNVAWMSDLPASLRTIMRTFALTAADLDLPPDQRAEVESLLSHDRPDSDIGISDLPNRPEMLDALDRALCNRRDRVRAYLEQMRIFDTEGRILLVDIGYSGTALKALSEHIYQCDADGLPTKSTLTMVMFSGNRFFAGNLPQMHPRVTMRAPYLIGCQNWRHLAAAVNSSWLEPFVVDRSRGSLEDFQTDTTGRLAPVFAKASGTPGPQRAAVMQAARQAEAIRRRAPLSPDRASKAIADAILNRALRPRRADVATMRDLTHHAGLTHVEEKSVIHPIRPWRLQHDMAACLREDRWLQGSLANSRLGMITPLANRVIGLISK